MKILFVLATLCLLFTISAVSQSKKDWEKVQSMNSWNAYEQFIISYPNGKYTEQAKQKQSLLKQPEVETTVEDNIVAAPAVVSNDGKQILVKKGRYYVDEKPLKGKELKSLLKSDPESAAAFKKSKTTAGVGYVLEAVTIIVLMPTVGALPGLLGGLLVATPFIIISSKQQKKAIEIYNSKHSISPPPAPKE